MLQRLALRSFIVLLLLGTWMPCHRAWAEDLALDDEPPPEGYEERRYLIANLLRRPADLLDPTYPTPKGGPDALLQTQGVLEVLRTCVAPDTWRARGPARMSVLEETNLVVLQTKEVQAELNKTLAWLKEGTLPATRITVVTASLKPDVLAKFAAGPITPADLNKALEEAGAEARLEAVELRGFEGQFVTGASCEHKEYISGLSNMGLAFQSSTSTIASGLRAGGAAYRSVNGTSYRLDLAVLLSRKPKFQENQWKIGSAIVGAAPQEKQAGKDVPIVLPGNDRMANVAIDKTLKWEQPSQGVAKLQCSLVLGEGTFTLAGNMDLSATGEGTERVAVFARVSTESHGIPTLEGVTGLKEGEAFKLYPLLATVTSPPDAMRLLMNLDEAQELGESGGSQGGNPFLAQPPAAILAPAEKQAPAELVGNTKRFFAEQVRKNKIVSVLGPVLFARLKAEDHQKLQALLREQESHSIRSATWHVHAVALTPQTYRKLLIQDAKDYEAADLAALDAGAGNSVLADSYLQSLNGQMVRVGAHKISANSRVESAGGWLYPYVYMHTERGYEVSIQPDLNETGKFANATCVFRQLPGASAERKLLDTYSMGSEGGVVAVAGVNGEMDMNVYGLVNVKGSCRVQAGKYVMLGGSKVSGEKNAEPRQLVVFLGLKQIVP